jgi:hypothetical protein
MNQEKFQTAAIVFLVFAVNLLVFFIWRQNMAIANLSKAIETLARSKAPMSAVATILEADQVNKGFVDFFREFTEDADKVVAATETAPAGTVELAKVQVDNCPPKPDGVCGYTLLIYGAADAEKMTGEQPFYFAETAGGPLSFYGPYKGDLRRIVSEAKSIKTMTELR